MERLASTSTGFRSAQSERLASTSTGFRSAQAVLVSYALTDLGTPACSEDCGRRRGGHRVQRSAVGGPDVKARVIAPIEREAWTMAPIALLDRPRPSAMRLAGLWAMRGYLVVAVLLLLIKSVQLATGHA